MAAVAVLTKKIENTSLGDLLNSCAGPKIDEMRSLEALVAEEEAARSAPGSGGGAPAGGTRCAGEWRRRHPGGRLAAAVASASRGQPVCWVTGCEVVSGRAAVGLSIEAESELLVVASSATMTLNKRPGNEARGENPVPFGMSIDSILDVVPLLEALLRRPTYIHNKNNDPLGNLRFQFVFASINR
uniref:Uncharacterized protein n=1 Tax=Oryza sativa subsp. japonica TaxID=39947 RepID=Q8H2M5_ORYSJ|nr:unknown protein [Oryza sativa Japonica Group]